MKLEDVIKRIPTMAVDAVCVARQQDSAGDYSIMWVNDAFCRMYATTRKDALRHDPFKLYHWDYVADFTAALKEMSEAGKSNFSQDTLCLRCDGSSFWGGVSFVEISSSDDEDAYAIIFVRDIDDLKNREQSAELALIENEHLLAEIEAVQTRLMSAINMSPDPFGIFDARDRLVIWNPAFAETVTPNPDDVVAGMKKQETIEMMLANGYFDDAVGHEEDFLRDYMKDWRRGNAGSRITRIQDRDFKVISAQAPNGDRVVLRVDISEQLRQQRELESYAERLEEANQEISEQALHDELTGLGNRRYLNTRLEDIVSASKRSGLEIAALHIDLDRFKQINDTMGHGAGDHVLRRVAEILRSNVRKEDVVARIGGDEFIILTLCAKDADAPDLLADRLIEEICRPIPYQDRTCRLGASVGIARTPMIPAHDLLTCSDIALYKAKTGGRAMKAAFDHADLDNLKSVKRLSDDILRGLECEEFLPFFQPQVDIETGQTVAIEVLARWQHPERGLLPPSEFLDTALEIQADGRIDRIVFEKAIAAGRGFFAGSEDPPVLSFNVRLSRLMDAALVSDIAELDYPGRIAFELVESIFLEEEQASFFERIDALRNLGITFEVDDFGSGRASIVGLKRIGPDRLKVDSRLIQPIAESRSASRLVQSIIDIGRALDIGVTATGVETEAHSEELRRLGCTRMQGYYFGKPAPLEAIFPAQQKKSRSA